MAQSLKKLNEELRAKKKKVSKKKVARKPDVVERMVSAIEKIQQPVVNIEARDPVSYKAVIELNSRGEMVAARIDPVLENKGK